MREMCVLIEEINALLDEIVSSGDAVPTQIRQELLGQLETKLQSLTSLAPYSSFKSLSQVTIKSASASSATSRMILSFASRQALIKRSFGLMRMAFTLSLKFADNAKFFLDRKPFKDFFYLIRFEFQRNFNSHFKHPLCEINYAIQHNKSQHFYRSRRCIYMQHQITLDNS